MSCKICGLDLEQPCSQEKPQQIGPCVRAQELFALVGEFEQEFWREQRPARRKRSISDLFFF